jgi:hypothetical protein
VTAAEVVLLALATIACKAVGVLTPRSAARHLVERTRCLAPALLAALVVSQLVSANGVPRLDARAAGVVAAAVLAVCRIPLVLCVAGAAAAAALLRAGGVA